MHTHHHHVSHDRHLAHHDFSVHQGATAPLWSSVRHAVSGWAHQLGGAINKATLLETGRRGRRKSGKGPWSGPPGVPWGFPPMY